MVDIDKALFDIAIKEFNDEKIQCRVDAIKNALIHKNKLERLLKLVNNDLNEAKQGNYKFIVEKYVGFKEAEQYE